MVAIISNHFPNQHCPPPSLSWPSLIVLISNHLPSSPSKLTIYDCPFLTPLLEFDKGEYWPNIAHIPNIEINHKYL
uniref:Uncharacterized protein n=1 Tax=Solanum lycopersicum TaxID=4081 RepID=A0A3Q7IXQ6_SOLLC